MFRSSDNYYFCNATVFWTMLIFGLSLFSGCRCLSSHTKSKSVATPPPITASPLPSQQFPQQNLSAKSTENQIPQNNTVLSKSLPEKAVNSYPVSASSPLYKPPVFQEPQSAIPATPQKTIVSRPITSQPPVPSEPVQKTTTIPKTVSPTNVAAELLEKNNDVNNPNNPEVDKLKTRIAELEKALADNKSQAQQQNQKEVAEGKTAIVTPKMPRRVPTINASGVTVSSDEQRIRIEIVDKILFVPGTYRISPESEELLRKVAGEIRALDKDAVLEIEGHTDCLNSDPANATQKHDIASIKSMAVMEYFVKSLRWDEAKIRASSYGFTRPVADNGTPEGRNRNNRIEIVTLSKEGK